MANQYANYVYLSMVEVEYLFGASCCAQCNMINKKLEDFNIMVQCVPIMCDHTRVVNITKTLYIKKNQTHRSRISFSQIYNL